MNVLLDLSDLAREVLFSLPAAPNGLSAAELADGLLRDRSPRGRGLVRVALAEVRRAVGLLERAALDDFGRRTVLYGLPPEAMPRVRTLAALTRNGKAKVKVWGQD